MPSIKAVTGETLIFDKEKYIIAKNYRWFVHTDRKGHKTICTYINQRKYYLPKLIFNIEKGQALFKKNGNIFDFSDDNISILTRSDFGHITGTCKSKASKYLGVFQKKKRWAVKITKNNTNYYKCSYIEEYEAGIVADYIIINLFGTSAKRNFPELGYEEIERLYVEIQNSYGKQLEL